jgi:hypothetical protein
MMAIASSTSSTAPAKSRRTLVSTARRSGFASVEEFGGALSESATLGR